ncbi:hypothetical protein K461DRAFT_313427 [Myriangium duriaei CBS 260.36]|uniref:Inhibitor I9 domain-containing protein n=1 Tax=Myriangium duriaei CBS 260.36 TaxID=1168546 RepID=A0A9P4IZM7_9PEZI|nr:hypothetical protein K461DRAFT_313427 [Myriangium duriaei CBS 260.36]
MMTQIFILGLLGITSTLARLSASNELDVVDKYIITVKSHVDLQKHIDSVKTAHTVLFRRIHKPFSGLTHIYDGVSNFSGYAGHLHPAIIQSLRNDNDVAAIEKDRIWTLWICLGE